MAGIGKFLNTARHYGLKQAIPIIQFTAWRNRLERAYRLEQQARQRDFQALPGRLREVKTLENGALFRFEQAQLEAIFLAPDLARITWQPGSLPVAYGLAKTDWPVVPLQLSQTDDPHKNSGWQVASAQMKVIVQPQGGVQFYDSQERLLRDELPPQQSYNPETPNWSATARLFAEECIYGLGEQTGRLNRRGMDCRMWNTDPQGSYEAGDDPIYMPLPVYLGLHDNGGYLIFYENSFPASFHFDAINQTDQPQANASFEGGALRYYFIAGAPAQALQRFSELTGRPALPPRWSLGYHQSRWGYKSQAEIRQIVQGFREHDLPLSAIHLDIDYMDGFRVFSVNTRRFPDLAGLANELEQQGVKIVAIIDPGVKQDEEYALYQSGLQEKVFCQIPGGETVVGVVWPGRSVYPDFTNPAARAWWGQAYASLLEAGVAGIWHDMNEPTSFAASGGPFLPLATGHYMEGQGGDHRQAHNLYALLMNRAGSEALRRLRPARRAWILSRSGWVSQARYAWNWTGDSSSDWESLRLTIPLALGTGLSGQPYTGPDIGGFSGSPSAELYLRWLQMAAFLPFFRTHSALQTARREPWVFGEPYTSIIRDYLRLRYRLMPYLYSLAWEASQSGLPLVRPLFWDAPEAAELRRVDDAFLLGEALLAAPALEAGQSARTVYLPPGGWVSLWDDRIYTGPGQVEVGYDLKNIPIFVRQGSLLPMEEPDGRLELHLYPPEPGERVQYRLYSDAGDGDAGDGDASDGDASDGGNISPAQDAYRLDFFDIQREVDGLTLHWRNEGDYPFPYSAVTLILHNFTVSLAWQAGTALQVTKNRIALPLPGETERTIALRRKRFLE